MKNKDKYYEIVLNTLKDNNMPINYLIENYKSVKFIKTDKLVLDGYNEINNEITYNNESSIINGLIHMASSDRKEYSGICARANNVIKYTYGFSLNEGVTELYTERCLKDYNCFFAFEKVCASTLEHVYGKEIFSSYFENDSGKFRYNFDKNIRVFMESLDTYSNYMTTIRLMYLKENKLDDEYKEYAKILLEEALNDLIELIKEEKVPYKKYLKEELNSNMKEIIKMIGNIDYEI